MEYPQELHDLHKNLPFCPRKECPPGSRTPKLMATFCRNERYILHYRALNQALQHGVRVTKVHRIIRFDQSPWLTRYIRLVSKWDGRYAAKVLIAQPNFKGITILAEDLVLIEMG